jgi:hypothetical protein
MIGRIFQALPTQTDTTVALIYEINYVAFVVGPSVTTSSTARVN